MFNGFPRDPVLASPKGARGAAWRRDAALAVRSEAQKTATVVNFVARGVEAVGASDDGLVRLDLGRPARVDWTWEGAAAYQLRDPDDPTDRVWSGEVVQLDEDRGHIYVSVLAGEAAEGPFRVRPFGFLDALQTLFAQCETLPDRASGV
ncbi:MAG: hypothetical protein AAF602_00390, partial [Myxococcota bacterium]